MQEVFKDIAGANGIYQVSNLGNVKSYNNKNKQPKILTAINQNKGYTVVNLKGDVKKICTIHRLVAKAFIPNPKNKREVNHINGIKNDNRVENLEWSTSSENRIHAYKIGLQKGHEKKGKDSPLSMPVVQLTLDNVIVANYSGAKEASKQLGADASEICRCCNGKRKTVRGFKFQYSL
jgi:hypothetical protein